MAAGYVMVLHRRSFQAILSRSMFSILRFILIVGAIFYYSPVRQQGEGAAVVESLLAPRSNEPAAAPEAPPAEAAGRLETMWQALPNSAKQAVIEKILTTSGLTSASGGPTDTLLPEDRRPALSGGLAKPRN